MPSDPWGAVAEALGARLVRAWPLTGGVSARVQALEIARPDGVQRVVVRLLDPSSPHAASVGPEHALLTALGDLGLPVARPLHLDLSCTVLDGPFLVLPFVDGTPDPTDRLDGAAALGALLADLHAVDPALPGLPALPVRGDPRPELPTFLTGDLAHARGLGDDRTWPAGDSCVLHGDVWPGNVIWRGDHVAALLDWEDAAIGDPLADLATARVELSVAWGPVAAERLTATYASARPPWDVRRLAVWELYVSAAALTHMDRWGLPPDVLAARREATRACFEVAATRLR